MACAHQGIALPMPHLATLFNDCGSFRNAQPINDLTSPTSTAAISLAALFLASQMAPKAAAPGFVGIDMALERLMADRHRYSDLFRVQLPLQISDNLKPIRLIDLAGITAVTASLFCKKTSLSRTVDV